MGFIPKELKKASAKGLDDLIPLPAIAELLDGYVIKLLLDLLDEKFASLIPEHLQAEVLILFDIIATKNFKRLPELSASLSEDFLNLPFATSEVTGQWVAINVKMLHEFVKYLAGRDGEEV